MDAKKAASVKRAFRKVRKTGDELAKAKGDQEIVAAVEAHEKAKKSYGRALDKALDS